jgi:CRP/FNR family transcriptional regulator
MNVSMPASQMKAGRPASMVSAVPAAPDAASLCAECPLRQLCLPAGPTERRALHRGEAVFRTGEPLTSLYAVRTGFFKLQSTLSPGRDQVTGFSMGGEWLGLDAIGGERYVGDAIALEDSQVCAIPYRRLLAATREQPGLDEDFHRLMSRELARAHRVELMLGSLSAEERVASFLIDLAQRLRARGFSGTALVLRMTREEIGSHLGLQFETVSRALSRLQQQGVLEVRQRQVRIVDPTGLAGLAGGVPPGEPVLSAAC